MRSTPSASGATRGRLLLKEKKNGAGELKNHKIPLKFSFFFFDNNRPRVAPDADGVERTSRPPEMSSIENIPPENGTFECEDEKKNAKTENMQQ